MTTTPQLPFRLERWEDDEYVITGLGTVHGPTMHKTEGEAVLAIIKELLPRLAEYLSSERATNAAEIQQLKADCTVMRETLVFFRKQESNGYLSYCGFSHTYNKQLDKALSANPGAELLKELAAWKQLADKFYEQAEDGKTGEWKFICDTYNELCKRYQP